MKFQEVVQIHEGGPGRVDPGSSPLPGGVTEALRLVINAPAWLQIGGALLLLAIAVTLAILGWRRRQAILGWLAALPTAGKAAAIAGAGALLVLLAAGGYSGLDYVNHDNNFCTGCHVMVEAYVRFQESAHAELGCHDCHQQPVSASLRQLYLWVLERPEEIGPHAPVPDARCSSCHIDSDPERWPQIAASQGHRVHFESDDPELSQLLCVSCHGVRVHDFAPARTTCGQCHEAEAEIRLGRMTASTDVHCVVCHDFLGAQPVRMEGVAEDLFMMPDRPDCLGCHEMAQASCHETILEDRHERPVRPEFLRGGLRERPADAPIGVRAPATGFAGAYVTFASAVHVPAPVAPDTPVTAAQRQPDRPFLHSQHRAVSCLECHRTGGDLHGEVTVRTPRDCASCHHDPRRAYACESCHREADLPPPGEVTARMALTVWDEARSRDLPFDHTTHAATACTDCHRPTVFMPVTAACADCHADHHSPQRECATCHLPTGADVHPVESHLSCEGCHTGERAERPALSRTLCLMCHTDQRDHEPQGTCHACHMIPESPLPRTALPAAPARGAMRR